MNEGTLGLEEEEEEELSAWFYYIGRQDSNLTLFSEEHCFLFKFKFILNYCT